jgi:chromosome partitioning protein
MIVALVNQKGGVGKTTCTVNLAAEAASKGRRVLLIDLDPQANATATIAPEYDPTQPDTYSINDVLDNGAEGVAAAAIRETGWHPNLHLLPSELQLAKRERDNSIAVEQRLRRSLIGVADTYDLVLIDCPPNTGILTASALVAADYALLVTELGAASFAGLLNIRESVGMVRENYNSRLQVAGILINRVEHNNENRQRADEVLTAFGDEVWQPFVPKRAVIATAYGAFAPVNRFPGEAARDASAAFQALTDRLLSLSTEPLKV